MRLFSALTTGRETLVAHGTGIGVISVNIANSNTVGFKDQRAEFSDLLAESEGTMMGAPVTTGDGVTADNISTRHDKQGALLETGRSLDMAIEGNGYFIVGNGTDRFYTRNGTFAQNSSGEIITQDGDNLMGYTAESPDVLVPLSLEDFTSTPNATTTATLNGNIDISAPILTDGINFTNYEELNQLSGFNTEIQVVDSLGETHNVGLHFFHTDATTYEVRAYIDGAEVGVTPGEPVEIGNTTMNFPTTGIQDPGSSIMNLQANWANGSDGAPVTVDLSGFTGFAADSSMQSIQTDGNSVGVITDFALDAEGTLNVTLDNGDLFSIGTVPLATFTNVGGLKKVGDNKFMGTEENGDIDIGLAKSGKRGALASGVLENSTVDMAEQFVDMIRFQRGYQAGSQVISTASELINTTINLA